MPISANIKQGKNCSVNVNSFIGYKEHGGKITIGNNVVIMHDCILRTCTGVIDLGHNVSIGYGTIIHALGNVTIGYNTLLSPRVQIYAQNHGIRKSRSIRVQGQTKEGVIIGNDCWIGAGSIITDGVTIKSGVVIGAGSVVTSKVVIPEYEIWAGNPAKKVGERQ